MCFFPCETISSLIVKGSSDDDGDLCVKRISLKLVFTLKLLCVCLGHCDLKDYHFDYLVSGLLVSSTTINPWVIVTLNIFIYRTNRTSDNPKFFPLAPHKKSLQNYRTTLLDLVEMYPLSTILVDFKNLKWPSQTMSLAPPSLSSPSSS